MIREAGILLEKVFRHQTPGTYQIQAAIDVLTTIENELTHYRWLYAARANFYYELKNTNKQ